MRIFEYNFAVFKAKIRSNTCVLQGFLTQNTAKFTKKTRVTVYVNTLSERTMFLMMLYSEKVMDHFANPRNVGEIEDADGVGEVGNAKCGDIMKMYIKVDGNIITDVKFKTFGCGAAVATSSIATEMIKGRSIDDALKLTNKAVVEALEGLPPAKLHCSVLAEQAMKSAIADYYKRNGIDPTPIVGNIPECEACAD